ncbi:hypothetical protein [Roseivivax marinus]|uniref:hypothetical protein n=1 Tax=Roseivivax marinus TaxID=1379903 RepID=UPI0027400DA8|nr:hypothetical protein [Roseivivax marinus]
MTRAPGNPSERENDLTKVEAAVLALARLLGEAAAREACLEPTLSEDCADAPQVSEDH